MSDLNDVSDDKIISEVRSRELDSIFESVIEIEIEPDYSDLKSIADKLKTGRSSEALEDIKELIYEKIGVIL